MNVSVGAVCSFSHFGWSGGRCVEEGTILPVCLQNDDVLLKQPEVIARLEGSRLQHKQVRVSPSYHNAVIQICAARPV